ncbi:MAG: UDP-N-acetylmuramoyl-L-alanyl-D-glutamate--2,6-diaminopimelate ligase [Deltaproteobacteria bacterium]|nr:UDP-N-acetylmuramoyl-L-alanyl-D-glutamate--2,6-diaminopimelate ligase [Deltaproteobacteria bacterium]
MNIKELFELFPQLNNKLSSQLNQQLNQQLNHRLNHGLNSIKKLNVHPSLMGHKIKNLTSSSREEQKKSVYFAFKGSREDGHFYISEVISKGVLALVIEDESKIPKGCSLPIMIVPDARNAFDFISSKFFHQSDQKLYTVGVTGTNGKTSITYIAEYIFKNLNLPLGVIGTINHRLGAKTWDTELTTPDSWTLHKRLHDFYKLQAAGVVLEVSSHALDQKRVNSLNFDAVIFTNLTRDHLDYHKTMGAYFRAKQVLFWDQMWKSVKTNKMAIINGDDSFGKKLKIANGVDKIYFGMNQTNDYSFKILNRNYYGQDIELKYKKTSWKFHVPLIGDHSIYNLIPVLILGEKNSISVKKSMEAFKKFPGVPGRLQKVENKRKLNIFIDYAHTPDALQKVLNTLISIKIKNNLKNKIVCLFGCGGDRDKGKRPLMGKLAEKLSDIMIITSDNPRNEDPKQIIEDICKGLKKRNTLNVIVEVDRAQAIKKGIEMLSPKDVLIICGKGHENYQVIGSQKKYFSDYDEVLKNIN